uniref:60S ribosomal protein L44 n=1 Tax=Strombidium inclinatum TaxID=197538 RepID=A0A7S3IPU4_9SPIT|mmetsp:Transcript_32882/g.50277  ORF Transcript_32882/g.50277 Transcript_32882/m.50277 type:complete len:104 (+) Transcript_32882:73-384(+)|eukprot:CAMPEP_0170492764 /NCGR_PEP_ID=MMETSP0208-20121228/12812_1 /TAXON_ID=197538 /ORGANISM="Strombidium inclinatum, Strain S3" /LENGTH=103 /DNA_ID=CAMNT_0010768563 /DNA_START=73 /DNA_END=384 /DNA_ORIENTATION=-
MVHIPKTIRTYNPKLKKHAVHKVSQYKAGKARTTVQGKRRYDMKQKGFGGQTKPIFRKKAKNTKKIVLKLECTANKSKAFKVIKRCKTFILGKKENTSGQVMF